MERFDIAVAGSGIAGLAAALPLMLPGHRVTIFERFPEPRPVGSGLMIQPTGLAVLEALGLQGPDYGALTASSTLTRAPSLPQS